METRANYVLIGAFTLAVIAGVFGFIYWFQNIGGSGERLRYSIVFDGSVSGLRTGASVLFNGIRVGEVTGLRLDPSKPKQVVAMLSVDKSVTVREDTRIGLEFQGLTGIASVSLIGGDPAAKAVAGVGAGETPPVMMAPPGATPEPVRRCARRRTATAASANNPKRRLTEAANTPTATSRSTIRPNTPANTSRIPRPPGTIPATTPNTLARARTVDASRVGSNPSADRMT